MRKFFITATVVLLIVSILSTGIFVVIDIMSQSVPQDSASTVIS